MGTVNRPLQPADGTALPEKAGKFRLIARVTYDAFDDYTLAHITGDNGVEVYADVLFDATVAPFGQQRDQRDAKRSGGEVSGAPA